jgi:hypothetical protein
MTEPQRYDFMKMSRSVHTIVTVLKNSKGLRSGEKAILIGALFDIEDLLQACQNKRDEAQRGINGYKGAGR